VYNILVTRHVGGSVETAPPFLTSALDRGEWSLSHSCRVTAKEIPPDTQWGGSWVSYRAVLEGVKKGHILYTCQE
jgi:hypothetical protein